MKNQFIDKIKWLYKENGFKITLKRVLLSIWHSFFHNKEYFFYVDCSDLRETKESRTLTFECFETYLSIPKDTLNQLINLRGGEILTKKFLEESFQRNGKLWIAFCEEEIAGYHWTYVASFADFSIFPPGEQDASIHGAEVVKSFRGKKIWPTLIEHTLLQLKSQGIKRVFITCDISNISSYKSIKKTSFRQLGIARPLKLFSKSYTVWNKNYIKL